MLLLGTPRYIFATGPGLSPYALSGTGLHHMVLLAYALSGTERAYAATSARDIAMDMQCYRQVQTLRYLLRNLRYLLRNPWY